MNKYLRQWIDETYPLMGNDIEELDHYDLQKFADWMEKKFAISGVSGSLLVKEMTKLLEQYRDEEMPDWNSPFHYDAEGWAAMKYFIRWLECKSNDR